jgi:hypothetical protein
MLRRSFLAAVSCMPAALQAQRASFELLDLLGRAANALGAGDAGLFLEEFDSQMPGYQDLRAGVTALLAQAEVASSITVRKEEPGEKRREVKLDWMLHLTRLIDGATVERRRATLTGVIERGVRGRWRITHLEPLSFFAPGQF